jgi:tetratricopeptide (TPR) repeat protein
VRCFKQAIETDSGYAPAYAGLADVYLTQMDHSYLPPLEAFRLADEALRNALRLDDTLAEPHTSLGHLRLQQGAYSRALDALAKVTLRALESLKSLEALSAAEYVSSYGMALLRLALGDKDRAFERLSRAYEECSSFMPFLSVDPRLDEVRTDERFLTLLARLNLPPRVGR